MARSPWLACVCVYVCAMLMIMDSLHTFLASDQSSQLWLHKLSMQKSQWIKLKRLWSHCGVQNCWDVVILTLGKHNKQVHSNFFITCGPIRKLLGLKLECCLIQLLDKQLFLIKLSINLWHYIAPVCCYRCLHNLCSMENGSKQTAAYSLSGWIFHTWSKIRKECMRTHVVLAIPKSSVCSCMLFTN